MSDDRWHQIEDLFHQAADLAPAERAVFLDRACTGDEELRREVESLLAGDSPQDEFLKAAVAQAVELLPSEPDEGAAWIGKRIGRYSITGLIGKGGMGSVYSALRDDEFRMRVALKLLPRGTDTDAALNRFRTERQILAGLQHPNIARLLDGGATESGLPYFVMEYVDGKPLLKYAAPLSTRERLELFRLVCAAVQYSVALSTVADAADAVASDLLWLDGRDLRRMPLLERKRRLRGVIRSESCFLYVEHVDGTGAEFYRLACEQALRVSSRS